MRSDRIVGDERRAIHVMKERNSLANRH